MQLLVRVVVGPHAAAPDALPREPGVEARGDESIGALLALRGAHGERVGVFVLGMAGVSPYPAPAHGVARFRLHQLLPQLEVLDRAALASPTPCLPILDPRRHALD